MQCSTQLPIAPAAQGLRLLAVVPCHISRSSRRESLASCAAPVSLHCMPSACPAPAPTPISAPNSHAQPGRAGRSRHVCAASPLPTSQQGAVDEAVQCASVSLKPRLLPGKAPTKGFASSAAPLARELLHIEIPTADQSPLAVAQLAKDLAAGLVANLGNGATPLLMVCADPAVAKAAAGMRGQLPSGCRVVELKEACRSPQLDGGLLLLVAPTMADVALCQQLTAETWVGKGTILLNSQFLTGSPASLGLPVPLYDYCESALTVYALMPVEVKGLLGPMEGVVIRKATGKGGDAAALWRIFMAKGRGRDEYLQIAQTKRRPTSDDIQLAFINANAQNSPLTKLVSKFKGK